MIEKPTTRLRRLLAGPDVLVAPGAADAWTARLIEQAGFPVVYMTGAGVANTLLGAPDIGLVTMTEMVTQAARITNAVAVPVIADADTGYGGVGNVRRTVREYEQAGLAGLHIEDQESPKRCGHFEGKVVVPVEEMALRLEAALAARRDPDFVIIARTDARAPEGLDAAIARARRYAAIGADLVFVEAPESVAELEAVARALPGVPLVANMVEGGKTPLLTTAELGQMGVRLVLYANLALRLGARAIERGLATLQAEGTSRDLLADMFSWQERQALVDLDGAIAFEQGLLARAQQSAVRG